MKAKHIRKLRNKTRLFCISQSIGLFGWPYSEVNAVVLAHTAEEAIQRLRKRQARPISYWSETDPQWGKYKVWPLNTPYSRFIKYYD